MPVAGLGLSRETVSFGYHVKANLTFVQGERRISFNLSFFKSYVESECWPRYFKVTDTKYYFLKINSHFLDKMMDLTVTNHTCT